MRGFGKFSFWNVRRRETDAGNAGTADLWCISVMVAGFALGLLLMGAPADASAQGTYADGDLRLVDTDTGSVVDLDATAEPSGRLEIFDDEDGDGKGEWKGICDDVLGFLGREETGGLRIVGRQEAEVACRQLGLSGGVPRTYLALPESAQDKPSAYYLLDDLRCSGSEDRILGENRCRHLPRGQNNCYHDEAFGVTCAAVTSNNDATGQVVINSTELKTGMAVTADHSGITDADGKPTDASAFSYQWIRTDFFWFYDTEIPGATAPTYTL
ncbi:MAG: scavenger receptor cysteine-rich domain-containing protein, partial [Candidatus Dadabacteria bacterium]|nr:scavenger receptor cysteine-rich domain-containing protein [Candidatus Dadabacteria bacterium]